ncbi:hypothetical protein D770_05325 [Flammeovirgaceae bacterium 311]|nr:hypothetical protein D770_05325 [Flammeovirgaceae bacterium 311]
MKTNFAALILALALGSCSTNVEVSDGRDLRNVKHISWDELKVDPSKFDDDTIMISGEFHNLFEDVSINHNSDRIWINSFKPIIGDEEFMNDYSDRDITVYGLFNSKEKGHLSQYLGTIENVFYVKIE